MNTEVNDRSRPIIVVGVDGSEPSLAALRWAAQQARRTGAQIHAVTAWDIPPTIFVVPEYVEADYARDARLLLDHTVSAALGTDRAVPVARAAVQDRPARALVAAAEGAMLLVVGNRGRGALPGVHLGSVASYCVNHAPCPVVVVRGTPTAQAPVVTAPGSAASKATAPDAVTPDAVTPNAVTQDAVTPDSAAAS